MHPPGASGFVDVGHAVAQARHLTAHIVGRYSRSGSPGDEVMSVTTLVAFSADQVCRLSGLSMRQLGYWDRIGFFSPQYTDEDRRKAFSRIYSFRDVVGLRTLSVLRNKHGVSLQELKKVGAWLQQRYNDPWASLKFYVSARRVFFEDPTTGQRIAGRPAGQTAFPVLMKEIERQVDDAARQLQQRANSDLGRITRNRYVAHNTAVMAGTRVPTSAIWNLHKAGYSPEAIIQEYPRLTPEDVGSAIAHEEEQRRRRAS